MWSVYAYSVDDTRTPHETCSGDPVFIVCANKPNELHVQCHENANFISYLNCAFKQHKQQLTTEIRHFGCSHYLSYIIQLNQQSTYTSNCRSKIQVEICVQMCMVSNSCVVSNIPVCK